VDLEKMLILLEESKKADKTKPGGKGKNTGEPRKLWALLKILYGGQKKKKEVMNYAIKNARYERKKLDNLQKEVKR